MYQGGGKMGGMKSKGCSELRCLTSLSVIELEICHITVNSTGSNAEPMSRTKYTAEIRVRAYEVI
jgi:hypothetical protein